MQLAWNNPTPQLNLFFVRDMKVLLAICFSVLGLTALEVWVFTRPPALRVKALRMHFHFVLSALILVSARYVWRRLNALIRTKHLLHPGTLFKIVILFLLVMAQFTTVCVVLLAQTDPLRMSLIISFCLGSLLFMTFCMIVADICSFIYRKILCRKNRDSEFDRTEIKIRVLLSLIGALILIVAGLLCVTNLNVEHVTVPIKGLSPLYNGTTIVQISDIHLGPFNGKSRLHSIVQKVNDLQGDVVVITGDLVDSTVEALKEAVQPLKELKTKYGSYYITGNHEYYTGDVDNWLSMIPMLNVTPLVNQRVCLLSKKPSCEYGLYLAGLEDLQSRTLRYYYDIFYNLEAIIGEIFAEKTIMGGVFAEHVATHQ